MFQIEVSTNFGDDRSNSKEMVAVFFKIQDGAGRSDIFMNENENENENYDPLVHEYEN